jgi:hypothetical protein
MELLTPNSQKYCLWSQELGWYRLLSPLYQTMSIQHLTYLLTQSKVKLLPEIYSGQQSIHGNGILVLDIIPSKGPICIHMTRPNG